MLRHDENQGEMLERLELEHVKRMKQSRREWRSLFALVIAWGIYSCILPFTTSLDQIMLLLSIFLVFVGQFLYVMGMD